jgi:hypothetical protein
MISNMRVFIKTIFYSNPIIFLASILFLFILNHDLIAQNGLHLICTIHSDQSGDNFWIVSGIGDVNGDGYDDLLVRAPTCTMNSIK